MADVLVAIGESSLTRLGAVAYPVIGVIIGFVAFYLLLFAWDLFRAPYRQRDEARHRVIALEKEKTPHIEVHPTTGERGRYEKDNKTAWSSGKG